MRKRITIIIVIVVRMVKCVVTIHRSVITDYTAYPLCMMTPGCVGEDYEDWLCSGILSNSS